MLGQKGATLWFTGFSGSGKSTVAVALEAELLKRGWTDTELKGLAGENVLRVLKGAETVSSLLRKTRPASTKTIQQLDGRR